MDAVSAPVVAAAGAADLGTVQGVAAMAVLKRAIDMQAASAAQLIQALPQPALATSGSVGTQLDTFA